MDIEIFQVRCEKLLAEAQTDLQEFGKNSIVAIWYLMVDGMPAVTNYDFIEPEDSIKFSELMKGEAITKSTLGDLVEILKKQNEGYVKYR